jgi:RNA polymerase sigma factor (sigma-70 family)
LTSGKKIANEKAWTFCVVRRETQRQVHRRQLREISLESAELVRDERSAQLPAGEVSEVSNFFSLLSRREEEVMLLSMEDLKYREIGVLLGISANSVATFHRRAIRKLREVMSLGLRPAKTGREAKVFQEDTVPIKTSWS